MARSIMKATLTTLFLGLLGATWFFWHSMRDVNATFASYAVDQHYSRIAQSQTLETMIREGSIDDALARLQRNRDVAVYSLGQMRAHIDATSWRMARNEYIVDKLDSTLRKEVEYRKVNGETNSALAEQARRILVSYEE